MKSYLSNAIALGAIALISANSFAQETEIPFLNNDAVSTSHFYYPNQGQVADDGGNLHPEVLFHTEMTSPAYFFQSNKLSFVTLKLDSIEPDTSFRIDMEFYQAVPPSANNGESGINLVSQDERTGFYNYYLPHCPNGVEGVTGYERLIYEQAYQDIDVEFTSNVSGLKARFIVQPGANPDDILLKFTGQNSIVEQTNGDLEMYLGSWKMEFRQAYAYQVNNGVATLVNWLPLWVHDGNGIVSITTGTYDTGLPLIIEMGGPGNLPSSASASAYDPYWSTYYGGIGNDRNEDMTTDSDENLFTVSNVKGSGSTFPPYFGVSNPNSLTFNTFITQFGVDDEQIFATYYGGNQDDYGMAIAEDNENAYDQYVYIAGHSSSTNIQLQPIFSNFNQSKQSGIDGFIAKFTKDNGTIFWNTFYGGDGDDYITDITMDKTNHKMYLTGYTTSTNIGNSTGSANGFPVATGAINTFYQPYNQGGYDAFVGQYNTVARDLVWSTYYGGDGDDYGYAVTFTGNDVFIAGKTNTQTVASTISSPVAANTNGEFPLANPSGGAYVQSQLSSSTTKSYDGFVSRFDVDRSLTWATFFGGNSTDFFTDLAVNSQGVFVVGKTSSSTSTSGTCTVNSSGVIPNCATTTNGYVDAYKGFGDVLITQFSTSGQLKWATCYGDIGQEAAYGYVSCATDNAGNIYVVSNSFPETIGPAATGIPVLDYAGQYFQDDNTHITEGGYGSDNILLMFNDDYEQLWATYFGGGCGGCTDHTGDELSKGIATFNNNWVYFAGLSYGSLTPTRKSNSLAYYDAFHDVHDDGYITKLDVVNLATFLEELTHNGEFAYLKGFPNPATDGITLLLPFKDAMQVQVVFYNSLGQQVLTQNVNAANGEMNVNVSSLTKGVYFSKIITNSNTYVYSFVKE